MPYFDKSCYTHWRLSTFLGSSLCLYRSLTEQVRYNYKDSIALDKKKSRFFYVIFMKYFQLKYFLIFTYKYN